jgi:hypothetical protein
MKKEERRKKGRKERRKGKKKKEKEGKLPTETLYPVKLSFENGEEN